MEQHLPVAKDLQPGDLLKWYNQYGTPLYGVQIGWPWRDKRNKRDKDVVFCIGSRGGENFGEYCHIEVASIDKFYRFNATNKDEHGSDVAEHHINELQEQGYIKTSLYATRVPTIYCKCSKCGNMWDTMEVCAMCNVDTYLQS